jgi:hypothetical protein
MGRERKESMTTKTKTAKRWKCAECEFSYVSPIPVAAVEHKCITPPVKGKTRKGMLPEE